MSENQIVDVWMQHPTATFAKQPYFASLRRWAKKQTQTSEDIPLAATLAQMDKAGVSVGLVSAWHGPTGALISNDEVAGFVAQYPTRLHGIASVDLYRPMTAVRELRRCVNELGFKGLRIIPWLWGLPPDDRRYYPLYAECVELGVPFCTQIGHTGPLLSSEPGRPIPYLENVALDFPELKIVGGHVGSPWVNEALSLAHKFENFYIDTSAYKLSRLPNELIEYMRRGGAKKVMFGSNYPMLTTSACLEALSQLGLSVEDERKFLFENALTVFGLNPQG